MCSAKNLIENIRVLKIKNLQSCKDVPRRQRPETVHADRLGTVRRMDRRTGRIGRSLP